jgi:hypothetical protein
MSHLAAWVSNTAFLSWTYCGMEVGTPPLSPTPHIPQEKAIIYPLRNKTKEE